MRILHISAFALRGGCEKNCYHFINGSRQEKHDLIVLDKEGPMSREWLDLGVRVRHLDSLVLINLLQFKNRLKNALDNEYDLVICWSTIRLPLQLYAVREVTKHVKVYLGNPVGIQYKPVKDIILKMLFPSDSKQVTLMACSQYTSMSYRQTSYFAQFKLKVSLNPVALPEYFPVKNMNPGKFLLGMVARLDPIKDHATLIQGFSEVSRVIPEAELHIVGDGILAENLQAQVRQLGLSQRVYFHGDVNDVYHFLNQWNVFAYATTKEEGLGSAVAEALANGLPCVLSDLPMLRELAPESGLAQWFAAGDARALAEQIIDLYKDSSRQKDMAQRSYRYAQEHFGTSRFVSDYLHDVQDQTSVS